ncbi:DNA repair protein RadC [Flavobacterium sp. DG2-3]|uniref:RadC family protein n=1 Tax=Flavobacterium sp. DG2-3 TaxID=3068317 RepID=UPI00273FA24A|nr:DNA repair protein RadC [Flavobacterium sp. DG2-3]MDP5200792.1 DNA repair protein RadC [Flavobacterium sp. DG2-3]
MEKSHFAIKDWSEDDKPREKLMHKGKDALSDAELLAILIGSGSRNESAVALSQRILANVGGLNSLSKLSTGQLMKFKGIGEAKAVTIVAALELSIRRRSGKMEETVKITSSKMVFKVMQPLIGELSHEEFWVLFLNNSNNVISKAQLSKGGIAGTTVDIRLIFKLAFEKCATGLILCHNHPSGSLIPSDADKQITKKIREAGEKLDVKVLDHLIITESKYYSFVDEGNF